ncbi:hypothetical protein DAEQUDRAFT_810205 [Daedalea quercina L-15889]|uniref:RING-type domain-containing protein n=1 Tax=Daedalea quercina L-15889 TaxID=1314783 RepID=A0A165RLG6_9APHY|nr:hypothetical protein DAEQUDRAFT_810205 [Daedalea quercina L-15889]
MSTYNYVDVPNQNLVCCICRSPFIDPCTTRTCCHTFCYECIARAIAISAQCPVDRCSLSIQDLAPADPLIRNLVDELVVECPQKDTGCSHTCQRILLPAHLKDSCRYVKVPCPDGKCSKGVLRKDLTLHTHMEDVPTVAQPGAAGSEAVGPSKCPTSTWAGNPEDEHSADECAVSSPTEEETHTPPPSSATNNPSYESLEAENARLRLRLSALEGVVNTLRYELQAVRRALGPWYRTEDSDDMRRVWGAASHQSERSLGLEWTPSRSVDVEPISIPHVPSSSWDEIASTTSTSAPAQATSSISPVAASELPTGDDISSYFPPAEEEDVYSPDFIRASHLQPQLPQQSTSAGAGPNHAREPRVSHQPHLSGTQRIPLSLSQSQSAPGGMSHAYPPHAFSPTAYPTIPAPPHSDPGAISIPPLDPRMPLPSTLASLHGSIASLAGALGALATTRTQDALYTGEELRSMRAGIHGLRMQLHDALTAQVASRDTSNARATDPEGASSGGIPLPGAPSWMSYGPRPFGTPAYPHMSGGFTKL